MADTPPEDRTPDPEETAKLELPKLGLPGLRRRKKRDPEPEPEGAAVEPDSRADEPVETPHEAEAALRLAEPVETAAPDTGGTRVVEPVETPGPDTDAVQPVETPTPDTDAVQAVEPVQTPDEIPDEIPDETPDAIRDETREVDEVGHPDDVEQPEDIERQDDLDQPADTGETEEEAEPGQRKAARERSLPALPRLPGPFAAALGGALLGLVGAALAYLSLRGCEAVRGAETCGGGVGLLVLLIILVVLVLLGGALFAVLRVAEPKATAFLMVGVLTVVLLLTPQEALFSAWVFLVVPLIGAVAGVIAGWVTSTFVEPRPEDGPAHDVR